MKHAVWSSKWTFILAAIGAAAGLGNLWKFPYLTYSNGGAAFLVAYVICLLFLAKPIIMTEVAMAQKLKKDVLGCFDHSAGKGGRFFAWCIILLVAGLATYYAAIIGWGWDFLVASPNLAWEGDAQGYFHNKVLHLSEGPSVFGGFSMPIVFGLIATYGAVYLSIFKGIVSVGKVVKWSVPIPFLLLFVLFVNATTLEGAFEGFRYFLVPDWSALSSISLWKDAITMSFFSTNVGLALTIVYAQFNKEKTDVVHSSWMIGIGDFLVSFIAGLAMFGTLGYMASSQGVDIQEVVKSGPTLAFVTIPTALAALPIAAGFFAVLFFLSILTLAIDSMFAVLEVVISGFRTQFKKVRNRGLSRTVGTFCLVFFGLSLLFAGGNGLYRLDIIDRFLFSHLFYFTITAQVIITGWFFPIDDLRKYINTTSKIQLGTWFNVLMKFVAPIVFVGLYVSSLYQYWNVPAIERVNYGGYDTSAIIQWGVVPVVLIVLIALFLSSKKIER